MTSPRTPLKTIVATAAVTLALAAAVLVGAYAWFDPEAVDDSDATAATSAASAYSSSSVASASPRIVAPAPSCRAGVGAGFRGSPLNCGKPGKPYLHIDGAVLEVKGPSAPSIVERIVRQNWGRARQCATRVFPRPREGILTATVLAFTIAPDGRVLDVTADEGNVSAFASCLRRALRRLKFPVQPSSTEFRYWWEVAYGSKRTDPELCEREQRVLALPLCQ